jgi:hypothetical protein
MRIRLKILTCLGIILAAVSPAAAGGKQAAPVGKESQKAQVDAPPLLSPEEIEKEISAQKEQMEIIKRSTGASTPILEQSKVLQPGVRVLIKKDVIEFREPNYPIKKYSVSFATPVSFVKDPDAPKPLIQSQPQNQGGGQGSNPSSGGSNTAQKVFIRAFCTADREYQVSIAPVPAEFTCVADYGPFGKKVVKVRGQLIPDLRTFSLRFVPFEFPNCVHYKLYVMNGERNSYNVAGYVDKKRLENVLLYTARDTGIDTADFLKKAFAEAGKTLVYSDNGNLQEVRVEDRTSKVGKYAALSFGANLMKNLANEIAKQGGLPPLFKVFKNQPIYMEGYCEYQPPKFLNGFNGGQ